MDYDSERGFAPTYPMLGVFYTEPNNIPSAVRRIQTELAAKGIDISGMHWEAGAEFINDWLNCHIAVASAVISGWDDIALAEPKQITMGGLPIDAKPGKPDNVAFLCVENGKSIAAIRIEVR